MFTRLVVLADELSGVVELGVVASRFTGPAGDDCGRSLSVGDFNDDGIEDIAIGAPRDGLAAEGAAYIIFGAKPLGADLTTGAIRYGGESANDQAGTSVSAAGDVDGDGIADLLVGAPNNGVGLAYLLVGELESSDTLNALEYVRYEGESTDDAAGTAVAGAGDVNHDGYADMVIGAPERGAGAVYLVLGSTTPAGTDLSTADARFDGEASGDVAGSSVATAGDVNGDEFADFLVGAPDTDSNAGAAYLVLGSASPVGGALATEAMAYSAEKDDDRVGSSVSSAGDVNGDGYADIVIGAQRWNDAGAAYVVFGVGL